MAREPAVSPWRRYLIIGLSAASAILAGVGGYAYRAGLETERLERLEAEIRTQREEQSQARLSIIEIQTLVRRATLDIAQMQDLLMRWGAGTEHRR